MLALALLMQFLALALLARSLALASLARLLARLLALTMPLTILSVAVMGWAFAGMTAAGAILLGAVMAPTAMNLCSSVKGFKGTIDVKVEWQFYDRESSSVVETLTTEGSGTLLKFSNNGFDEMWDAAFVDALEKVREAGVIDRVLASDAAVVQVEATQEPGETAVDTAKDTSDMDDAAEMAPAS